MEMVILGEIDDSLFLELTIEVRKYTNIYISFYKYEDNSSGDGGLYIIEDIRDWCSKHDLTSWYDTPCKCSDTHLQIIEKSIPELQIVNMNEGVQVPDNIIGYYHNEKN